MPSDQCEPQLSDQDEGVFRTYEEQEASSGKREAELQMSHAELAEYARSANYRARQLAAENSTLRSRLGIEPGAELGGTETDQSEAPQGYRPYLGDESPNVGGIQDQENDLVTEPLREAELRDLIREVVRELLPRHRAIDVFVPGEGRARVDALEVITKTYPALVDTVAQLAARSSRVGTEDGFWALGISDEVSSLLVQVGMASPRRPKAVNRSVAS